MDQYLHDVQAHLRLAELTLRARLTWSEHQPKGMSFRHNRLAQTKALLAMVAETRRMAVLQDDGWWNEADDVPF